MLQSSPNNKLSKVAMIQNYFKKYAGMNVRQILVGLIFAFSLVTTTGYSQCAVPPVGCPNTDLQNFGTDSDNNAATIEYDNYISSFHSTIVRTSTGVFQTWGERMSSTGANLLVPTNITQANYPALTGTPLKAALASNSNARTQGVLLTTTGLFAWGTSGAAGFIVPDTNFQKLTIGGNANGLPTGVTPADVKMIFATYQTLALTTCSGDVWVAV